MATPEQFTPSPDAYAVFCGQINEENTAKLISNLTTATVKNQNVHLLFQSAGGRVGESVCLYSFFRALPIGLTLYNVGSIASGGVIAYLGAKRRITASHSQFMIHRTVTNTTGSPAMVMKGITKSLILDDQRTESIMRESITLPAKESWSNLDHYDFFFSGEEAVQIGLAHEIGEFSPPPGTPVYHFF
ncbi:MAG TPA: ATP-dependent Clp protease proteolytic subunit [Terracidiphilus sp.]|nr:ATP-dependent Clp protease proteolytic subunit [Terracidiphilus sp.]